MLKTLVPTLVLTLSCVVSNNAQAEDKVVVGKKGPDFTVTGIDGKQFKLSDKLGKDKNVVLLFSRALWCPFCMGQLVELQEHAEDFEKLNTELIFVFREEKDGVDALKKMKEKYKTKFTLSLDLDKKSSKAYSPESRTYDSYVLDSNGIVRLEIDASVRTRAKAAALIKTLKEIEAERK